MIRSYYLIFIILLFSNHHVAQSDLTDFQIQKLNELGTRIEGTFQIQMINSRSLPTFELILYDIINNKRDQTEFMYHKVNSNMRIMILPKEIIERPDFISIERIKYITSNDH